MPDSDRVSIDNLTLAPDLSSNDVAPVVHTVNGVKSTYKATMTLLGTFLNKILEYSADLTTTNKTIIGAINEINAGGGGGGAVILYGTTAPASSLGSDGNLYVQYTAGTGGASDVVDALYAKLDGEWCEISTKQIQSDWSQSDNTKVDYIKNKPTIPTDAEQLPITSGSSTNTKDYIDGRTPIKNGEHATDLSTTGLTTGTYLYKYDNTTNGIPKANTEGDCYITINETQAHGCELAVSNSGLYWRNKVNQVWGNWVDIISQLTVDSDISASPVDVNGTYQIPTKVLNHNIIVITFRRYGYAATVVATRGGITGGNYGAQFTRASVSGNMYWDSAISSSGLITLTAKGDTTVPYIEVFGYM